MTQDINHTDKFKDRSFRSCISGAIESTRGKAPEIIKSKWKAITIIALAEGALFVWGFGLMPGMLYVGFKLHSLQIALSCLLSIVLHLIIYSMCFSSINGKSVSWNVARSVKTIPATLCFLLLYFVIAAAISLIYICSSKNPESIPLLNILLIAVAALPLLYIVTVPLFYVYTKYQMEENTKLAHTFKKSYFAGFRHWGFIFAIQFLAALCLIAFEFTVCLPEYVLIVSHNVSAIGMASLGDPSGLPESFLPIAAIAGTIYGCIRFFEILFIVNVASNCYQTITARRIKAGKIN